MIDSVYKTVLTILNKENKGDISPIEYNLLAHNVQQEIFKEYFEDINRDNLKMSKGLSSAGYSNLPFHERQKITNFETSDSLTLTEGSTDLPSDLYFMIEDGVTATSSGRVVEEVKAYKKAYMDRSSSPATAVFPVYSKEGLKLSVSPSTIGEINIRYIRSPKAPQWTFITIGGNNIYNPSSSTHQDFELHPSEFSNIVVRMLSLFGVVIRDVDIIKIAESLKNTNEIKDNQ